MEFLETIRELDLILIIKLVIGVVSFSVGIYFSRLLKQFFLWLKSGIENGDGKLENKELQIALFATFCGFILITIAIWSINWPTEVIYAVFGTTAALFGVKSVGESFGNPKNIDSKNTKSKKVEFRNESKIDIDEELG